MFQKIQNWLERTLWRENAQLGSLMERNNPLPDRRKDIL